MEIEEKLKFPDLFFEKNGFQYDGCGNYMGWVKNCGDFNILISYNYTEDNFNLTVCDKEFNSSSDPNGKMPYVFVNIKKNVSFDTLKELVEVILK